MIQLNQWLESHPQLAQNYTSIEELGQDLDKHLSADQHPTESLHDCDKDPVSILHHEKIAHRHYTMCDSTQDVAKAYLMNDDRPILITSDFQYKGYGQNGKWLGSFAQHLNATWVIPKLETHLPVSMIVSYLLMTILKPLVHNASCELKWPNDIIINNHKVSGIIAESSACNKFWIIGIGANLNPDNALTKRRGSQIAPTILNKWTSLPITRNQLIQSITLALLKHIQPSTLHHFKNLHKDWNKHDYFHGMRVRNTERRKEGIGQGINSKGHYTIRTAENESLAIYSGSICKVDS